MKRPKHQFTSFPENERFSSITPEAAAIVNAVRQGDYRGKPTAELSALKRRIIDNGWTPMLFWIVRAIEFIETNDPLALCLNVIELQITQDIVRAFGHDPPKI